MAEKLGCRKLLLGMEAESHFSLGSKWECYCIKSYSVIDLGSRHRQGGIF